ncbi:MAG: DEAD/DEAH box helicase, partial [Longimicrobiales bacterium]
MPAYSSPLDAFHPLVQQWWQGRFAFDARAADGAAYAPPTSAQAEGWAAIRSGDDTLIAAPTGSGKTLGAFLHAIDALLRE